MRRPGSVTPGALIIAILLLVGLASARPALAWQEASPAAGTPAPEVRPTEAPPAVEPPAATPAAAPEQAQSGVVTLVFWYANPVEADLIDLFPLVTDAGFVASPAPGASSVGTVDFPADGVSAPTIVIGDTTFTAYPRPDGVFQRWTWLDDFDGARPATLVMQVSGAGGQYQDFYGTSTFVSRDAAPAGGVLIIALRPPDEAAAAAEEAAPADEAVAEEAPAEVVVIEEAPAEPVDAGGIVIEGEGEAPAA